MLGTIADVALLTEGVDRNGTKAGSTMAAAVALLTEGVDRNNNTIGNIGPIYVVALLTEGVDRNDEVYKSVPTTMGRPPHGGRG